MGKNTVRRFFVIWIFSMWKMKSWRSMFRPSDGRRMTGSGPATSLREHRRAHSWQVLSGSLCLAFCFLVVFFLILGKAVAAQIRK